MVGNLKPLAKRMMKRNLDGAFSAASLAIFHFPSFDQTLNSLCIFLEGNEKYFYTSISCDEKKFTPASAKYAEYLE